jgi:polar amino acid transport system ATP-binding protein
MTTAVDETILEVQGLKKWYRDVPVLKGIDLCVTRADVFVIIGPNGCGKSTLLRCLNMLEPYQEGRVLLRGEVASWGRPIHQRPNRQELRQARRLRRRVGMVFQQFNLFPHLSVLQNVMIGPLRVLRQPPDEARGVAETMLRKVGLWEKAEENPLNLSGGQQQRAAIARTLAMSPDIVLLDEVTSALDIQTTLEVLRVIRDLVVNDGMTTLMITHDMDFARDIADQIIFMHQGLINARGTPAEILDKRPTAELEGFLKREILAGRDGEDRVRKVEKGVQK